MATSIGNGLTAAIRAAGPVLFPHFCVGCGDEGRFLCNACLLTLQAPNRGFVISGESETKAVGAPISERSGAIGASHESNLKLDERDALLRFGALHATALDGVVSMASYADPVLRSLLHAYKYEGIDEAGEALDAIFAAWLEQHTDRLRAFAACLPIGKEPGIFSSVDASTPSAIVLPSPMHPLRERLRGFNQADRFAHRVAEALGAAPDRMLLRRSYMRRTQVEAGTDAVARTANVRGTIRATHPVNGTCIIVDDVITTGATLVACADALRAAGATRIIAVTVLAG